MFRPVTMRDASEAALPAFAAMEAAPEVRRFIRALSLAEHKAAFAQPEIRYLCVHHGPELVGFFLLAVEEDGKSVEMRRIVMARRGDGIGQRALREFERFSRESLGRLSLIHISEPTRPC